MTIVLLAVGALLLLGVVALLAAFDAVLDSVDLIRALAMEEEDDEGSRDLVWLLEHRDTSMAATLVLTVLLHVATAGFAIRILLDVFGGAVAGGVGIAATWVVVALLGEVVPRSLVRKAPDRAALRLAPAMRTIVGLADPIASVFVTLGRSLAGVRPETAAPYATELDDDPHHHDIDDDSSDELEEEERAMIRSVVELGDTLAREIMMPRPDMVTVARTAPLREVVNVVVERGYSRLPVHGDDRDELLGLVYAKDVLKRVALQPTLTGWRDLVRPVRHVPETKPVDDLLREMQDESVHMVLVVDEYGATTGLVTIEDVLEEIVGEIVDEHDQEISLVELRDDGSLRVDARLSVDDLNELLDLDLPDDDWDTVGGLVVSAVGRVPEEGEQVDLDRITITAVRMQGRRVAEVEVAVRPLQEEIA